MRTKTVISLIIFGVIVSGAHARDLYVSVRGSDKDPGTKSKPWRTLTKAASEAKAGDVVLISSGIYRETLKPLNSGKKGSPIVFKALPGQNVSISGAEAVKGWTQHSGKIYKAKLKSTLGKNNQIFFDEKPLQEARWPNDKDGDPMTPDGAKIEGGSTETIISSELPRISNIEGAVVWALPQCAWSSWTSPVTEYLPEKKKVVFQSYQKSWWVREKHNPKSKKGEFYLVGSLGLLDTPGEWYYDAEEQVLYLRPPNDSDPNKHVVSAKVRPVGLNLSGRLWIKVEGINLVGTTVDLSDASYCTVKGMKAVHLSHTRGGRTQNRLGEKSGIHVSGNHNVIRDCEIAYSAGNGVSLMGNNNSIINCWIHHVDYIGAYCAPVTLGGLRNLVSHNTISVSGRDCIKLGGAEHLIQYNDISWPARICHDSGVIYSGGQDGGNTRIRYNWVHDNPGPAGYYVGIYLDNYMKNYIVDHNLVWNVGNSIRLNRPTGFCMILNNTVDAQINNNWGPWKGQKVQWGSHVMNNVTLKGIKMNREVPNINNTNGTELSQSFDIKTHKATGKRIGDGIEIPGITGKKPGIGAFSSKSDWKAGHDFKTPPNPVYSPASEFLRNLLINPSFDYIRYYKEANLKAGDGLIGWKKTHGQRATLENHPGFNSPPAGQRKAIHSYSLFLSGPDSDGVEQKLSGLTPDTSYVFSAYVRHDGDVNVILSVDANGNKVKKESKSVSLGKGQNWRLVTVRFNSGKSNTAKVSILKTGKGSAHIDDTGVVPTRYLDLIK